MGSAGKLLLAVGSENEVLNFALSFFSVWLVGLVLGWLVRAPQFRIIHEKLAAETGTVIRRRYLYLVGEILGFISILHSHAHSPFSILQLPRPKWMRRALNSKNAFMLTPPGLWLGRGLVAWNSMLVVREVWYRFCTPGTFRAILKALWISFKQGTPFEWPNLSELDSTNSHFKSSPSLYDPLRWYVTTDDLQKYKDSIESETGAPWEKMLEKQWNDCTYTAWRRSLPNGKTEYKSVTISKNSTAQEFMDFYLDDDIRPKWDGMISEHSLLENAHDQSHRCQVVRWVRTFPFAFLSRREYVIARRVFKGDDETTLYGITKGIEHPAAPPQPGVVRMSTFYSMWRSRTIPCPDGSGQPACETTLLHFEDFGIPENLARFAVRHGMAGFVGKMVPYVETFVQQRRTRCDPFKNDAQAYGAGITPLVQSNSAVFASSSSLFSLATTTIKKKQSSLSSSSSSSLSSMNDSASEYSSRMPTPSTVHRSPSLRGLGYMLLASGVAIAVGRTSSSSSSSIMNTTTTGTGTGTDDSTKRRTNVLHHNHHGGISKKHHHSHHHSNHSLIKRSSRYHHTSIGSSHKIVDNEL